MLPKPISALAAVLGLVLLLPALAGADLLISEMCDPRYDYASDRFIEIYNAGANPIDLAGWTLYAVGNGGDIFSWGLVGSIEPGEALVAGDQTTAVPFQVDFPEEAWSSSNGFWNGKVGDGARLVDPSQTTVDYVVVEGTAFENKDYVRRSWVTEPSGTYSASEWMAYPADYPTDGSPGVHTADPPPAGPTIQNVRTEPERPRAGDAVHVFADVRDTTAALESVTVSWGTMPGELPNTIPMEIDQGDTYRTSLPIAAHSAGTTVYFQVTATNEVLVTRSSAVLTYALPYEVTIHEVQGEGEESPYDNEWVITGGVVTAVYDAYFVLQDGSGPWEGVWVASDAAPASGDEMQVWAMVDDGDGNTTLTTVDIESAAPGGLVPSPEPLATGDAASEPYEGVLVAIHDAQCVSIDPADGVWVIADGTGPLWVGVLGNGFEPTLGSRYAVTGPVRFTEGSYRIEPRDAGDVEWVGDDYAPIITGIVIEGETALRVHFSEAVTEASAEIEEHYSIGGLTVAGAEHDAGHPEQVLLTVSPMAEGPYTLVVTGVTDLFGNVTDEAEGDFDYVDYSAPEGYYDTTAGLEGEALQAALHEIIDGHTAYSYSFLWDAFYTTDDKPNGKVWDVYSDLPGGEPPYEYTFGEDQGGVGGQEGTGYTREHSWPKSWYGGEVLPMFTDLFVVYPCDAHVNGMRGTYPYGEVSSANWVSMNGSEIGPCTYPGYTGTVFEPIDAYKGDLARTYLYMTTRYYGEDGGWPSSPMTVGAELRPWALDMLLEWHAADPVSRKERERNATVFGFQTNRNPFIDHPEFVELVFGTSAGVGEEGDGRVASSGLPRLLPAAPNPVRIGAEAVIRFQLPAGQTVSVEVCDITGRRVAELADGVFPAGVSELVWDARLDDGAAASSGIYFVRLRTEAVTTAGRLLLLH